jgi:hypothetical protein
LLAGCVDAGPALNTQGTAYQKVIQIGHINWWTHQAALKNPYCWKANHCTNPMHAQLRI